MHDVVEQELQKEADIIHGVMNLLRRTVEESTEQIRYGQTTLESGETCMSHPTDCLCPLVEHWRVEAGFLPLHGRPLVAGG